MDMDSHPAQWTGPMYDEKCSASISTDRAKGVLGFRLAISPLPRCEMLSGHTTRHKELDRSSAESWP
jgi:hypothetical protein